MQRACALAIRTSLHTKNTRLKNVHSVSMRLQKAKTPNAYDLALAKLDSSAISMIPTLRCRV